MKKARIVFAALLALVVCSLAQAAGTPSGVLIQQTSVPRVSPYFGLNADAIVGARATPLYTVGNNFVSAFRADMLAMAGGQYGGGVQSGYFGVNAPLVVGTQGQAFGYWTSVQGLGKGNAGFGSGYSQCWGGGEVVAPDGTPQCSALGEYEADTGNLVFSAQVTGTPTLGQTTIAYNTDVNESALGARLILRMGAAQGDVGTLASISGTTLTFAGTTFTGWPHYAIANSWYVKLGSDNEGYAVGGGCAGDDVVIAGKCYGHWYKVASIPDNTHLVLAYPFDAVNLAHAVGLGVYLALEGAEIQNFDAVANTITIPANPFQWNNGNAIISAPNHIQGYYGIDLITRKLYKTGDTTVTSAGIRIANFGPGRLQNGILLTGETGTGLGGFYNGIRVDSFNGPGAVLDTSSGNVPTLLLFRASTNGSTNSIYGHGSAVDATITYETPADTTPAPAQAIWNIRFAALNLAVGLNKDGTGAKHTRVAAGCTTAAAVGATCTAGPFTYTTAYAANANYTLVCSIDTPTGVPVVSSVVRTQTTFSVVIAAMTAVAATGTLNCIGLHD